VSMFIFLAKIVEVRRVQADTHIYEAKKLHKELRVLCLDGCVFICVAKSFESNIGAKKQEIKGFFKLSLGQQLILSFNAQA